MLSSHKEVILLVFVISCFIILHYQSDNFLSFLGKYLSPKDKITRSDAIVVLSGSDDRLIQAIELYKQGYAPKLILSGAAQQGNVSNALVMQRIADASGIPAEATILDEKSTNTYENALDTKKIVIQNGIKSLILVTSEYHQRRAYETFKYVFQNTPITIENSPSKSINWDMGNWWQNDNSKKMAIQEYGKIFWAKLTNKYY